MSTQTNVFFNIINAQSNLTLAPVGEILLTKNPVSNLGAATKEYVDNNINTNKTVTIVSSATYSILPADIMVASQYSQTGPQTLTLPLISAVNQGKVYHIVDTEGNALNNNITILTSGANKIVGQPGLLLNGNYQSFSIFSNGTNWFIF
jgi:hypothetical protein